MIYLACGVGGYVLGIVSLFIVAIVSKHRQNNKKSNKDGNSN